MATPRTQQLANLAANLPTKEKEIAQRQKAATDIQLQQFVKQAQPTPGAAQSAAATAVSARAQPQLAAAQREQQIKGQLGQQELQAKQAAKRKEDLQRRTGALREQNKREAILSKLDNGAKNQLIDRQMQLQQDRFGRTLFTEQNMMDFAVMQSRDEVELQKYADHMRRATENEIYMLKVASEKIQAEMERQMQLDQSRRKDEYVRELAVRKHELEKKMRKKKADKANRASMISTAVAIGVTGAVMVGTGGTAAAYAPAIYAGTQGATQAAVAASDEG